MTIQSIGSMRYFPRLEEPDRYQRRSQQGGRFAFGTRSAHVRFAAHLSRRDRLRSFLKADLAAITLEVVVAPTENEFTPMTLGRRLTAGRPTSALDVEADVALLPPET